MDWDSEGRPISVRGRRVRMTREDVVAFLKAVAEAFPSVRFLESRDRYDEPLVEIPRERPTVPAHGLGEVRILFVGPDWQPEYHPARRGMLVNFPLLNASIWPAKFFCDEIREIGCKIVRCDEGLLNANHYYADEPGGKEGKRVIDKLFRLHRKLVDNKVVPIDLRTGEVAGEIETDYEWYGADVARQCFEKQDHYLDVRLSRESDRFWGYKPVRVPGKPTD
jgi:hypothetical protein